MREGIDSHSGPKAIANFPVSIQFVNHYIKQHGLTNLISLIKLSRLINKLFVCLDLLIEQIPSGLFVTQLSINFLLPALQKEFQVFRPAGVIKIAAAIATNKVGFSVYRS